MISLNQQNISLGQKAAVKQQAISHLAASLKAAGYITEEYAAGMWGREQQSSTYLGNGIAIPHGTTETKQHVQKTGVFVHQFPQGVDWGDGNRVYLAIGIAAKSDEHLEILKQLTRVLSADGVEGVLRNAQTSQEIVSLINGEQQTEIEFDEKLVLNEVPVENFQVLSAVAAGMLKNRGCLEELAVAQALLAAASYLGEGAWLLELGKGAKSSGFSLVRPTNSFEYAGKPVSALLCVAVANTACINPLQHLAALAYQRQLAELSVADAKTVVYKLKSGSEQQAITPNEAEADNSRIVQIRNPHGLHARPGALLVAEAKKFASAITVANLDGDAKAVNAKSLMKVMTLGVKSQHRLQFIADGDDAQAALQALELAIDNGLGES
ncbi:HPr family phosphocarrier protein [Agarivorans sp. B2Z047]|nr:HPr family phosphocarrier protein [Agarivorans sp. B2Z047]